MKAILLSSALVLSAICQPAGWVVAQCLDYSEYLHWEGGLSFSNPAYAVDVSGTYAYVACGGYSQSSLVIVDIADPQRPQVVGSVFVSGEAQTVDVDGDLACIGTADNLYVVDVGNPASPEVLGSVPVAADGGLVFTGSYAFVVKNSFPGRFSMVSIGDPRSPQVVAWEEVPDQCSGLAVSGSYAYAAGLSGLYVIHLDPLSNPTLIGSVATPSAARSVAVAGQYAYVACWSAGLLVVRVANPQSPSIVGSVAMLPHYAKGVAVSGHYAYVGASGVRVVDVSTPSHPELVGAVTAPDWYTADVAVAGGHAYLADADAGLIVVNIANPENAPVAGSTSTSPYTPYYQEGLVISGTHAYATAGANLAIIDIGNPLDPVLVGGVGTSAPASSVAIGGTYAYVVGVGYPNHGVMDVIDVSNPESPDLVTSLDLPAHVMAVAVAGSYAYVTADAGLHVIDIAEPEHPRIVGSVGTADAGYSIAVAGDHAYVGEYLYGLQVVDISDPQHPAIVGGVQAGTGCGVAVEGNYAYLASSSRGLAVIDVSTPSDPHIIGQAFGANVKGVAVAGDYAYFAACGLQVVDIADPMNPRIVGTVNPPGGAYGIAAAGGHVYLIAEDFEVLWPQCGDVTASPAVEGRPRLWVQVNPNPMLQETVIHLETPAASSVELSVYDIGGRRVRTLEKGVFSSGPHNVHWDGRSDDGQRVAAGLYLVRVATPAGMKTTRVIALR